MKIGIIGGGNMGLAILSRIAKTNKVLISERDSNRAQFLKKKYRLNVVEISQLVRSSQVIIVAVKPQDMDAVLEDVKFNLKKGTLVISIAAGITTKFLERKLGRGVRVIRTMPNMPAQIGEGITAIAKGKFATSTDVRTAVKIFNHVGETIVVRENLIDSVTAVSGSGPAYVFLFAECLLLAARKVGLDEKMAKQLVSSTLKGSVHQMLQLGEEPASLRAKVTSKGGTTHAAIQVFEKHHLRDIFVEALLAAKKRAAELAKR